MSQDTDFDQNYNPLPIPCSIAFCEFVNGQKVFHWRFRDGSYINHNLDTGDMDICATGKLALVGESVHLNPVDYASLPLPLPQAKVDK